MFTCSQCNKNFSRKFNLQRHQINCNCNAATIPLFDSETFEQLLMNKFFKFDYLILGSEALFEFFLHEFALPNQLICTDKSRYHFKYKHVTRKHVLNESIYNIILKTVQNIKQKHDVYTYYKEEFEHQCNSINLIVPQFDVPDPKNTFLNKLTSSLYQV